MTLDKWRNSIGDSILPELLIKLDVQGYENKVIEGGANTFLEAKACIVEIALSELYKDQSTFDSVYSVLHTLGYTYSGNLEQVYNSDGHVISLDAVFINRAVVKTQKFSIS